VTKKEEKAWTQLREHRDALAKLASASRTSFLRKEDQVEHTRIGELLQQASDACDLSMGKIESGNDSMNEVDRMRARLKDWRF
jgi:hypothetical protein